MRQLLAAVCFAVALAAPAGALASGGPVPPQQGGAGIALPGGPDRYVALAAGHGNTLVERVATNGGAVRGTRLLRGHFGVAGVAYDGSNTGLSADGRTLVLPATLSPAQYPPTRTRLAVLDALRLRPRETVSLPGYHAVDAVSPDGRWLYLIHYTSNDGLHYEVRAYDLVARRLLAAPVVDSREPDEKMNGIAVTRVSSADGRWAYTLYQRPEGEPFVHALDTATRSARCIDLPALDGGDLSGERLRLDDGGASLVAVSRGGPQAVVDTTTFAVRRPAVATRRSAPAPERSGDSPWVLLLLPATALVALSLAWRRRRLRSSPA
jgi:hypothetical protein